MTKNSNLPTLQDLRDLVKIGEAIESLDLSETSIDSLVVSDINGDHLADWRFIADWGTWGWVFDGQTYSAEDA